MTACGGGGDSTPAATVPVTPGATEPGAPTIGLATAGDGSASIAFTAPASDGGSAITGYRATCVAGAASVTAIGRQPHAGNRPDQQPVVRLHCRRAERGGQFGRVFGGVRDASCGTDRRHRRHRQHQQHGRRGLRHQRQRAQRQRVRELHRDLQLELHELSRMYRQRRTQPPGRHLPWPRQPEQDCRGAHVSHLHLSPTLPPTPPPSSPAATHQRRQDGARHGGTCTESASATSCSLAGGGGAWSIEALGQSVFNFGIDINNAHVQSNGSYHYHGMPEG